MELLKRLLWLVGVLWFLISSNPSPSSFRRYARRINQDSRRARVSCDDSSLCVYVARALEPANSQVKAFLARPFTSTDQSTLFFGLDCFLFSILYTQTVPPRVFLGIANTWFPIPLPPPIPIQETLRNAIHSVSKASLFPTGAPTLEDFESFREKLLPERPWEVLTVLFALTGAYTFLFAHDARRHFALSWHNLKHARRWWCLILFHFSHGNSILRLSRTIAAFNYLAPLLLKRRILTLSGLYGVVLTGGAVSGMLCLLVLVRRNVNPSSQGVPRPAVDIYGGGGCVYALLVAACLSSAGSVPLMGGIRPFQLLMLNVAFDAIFLAGDSADYTAHVGAALGSWIFCALGNVDKITKAYG